MVPTRWCQLRVTVNSTVLAVLGSARRQYQFRSDKNDAISNLLSEKNILYGVYLDGPTDSEALGRALQKGPQLALHNLRRPIDRLPELEINVDLDPPPCLTETIRAVQQLSNGNARGSNALATEIYKHGDYPLME
nr:unnamed protein product [Spirometra erinaceieuropaei]